MSEFSYRMNVFGHSARSAGLLIFGWRNLARLSGNASRVTKLFNTLEDMGNLQIEKRKKNFKDGDYIEFENWLWKNGMRLPNDEDPNNPYPNED